jgi:hypothetical protein
MTIPWNGKNELANAPLAHANGIVRPSSRPAVSMR